MEKYKIKEISDKKVWEDFLLSQKPQSFLQSWNWGQTNLLLGKKIFRLGIYKGQELEGVCLVIREQAKRGPHFVIPGGPILEWKDKRLVSFFLNSIRDLAKKEKVWFIRVRPEVLDTSENRALFRRLGFIPAPFHLHAENTWVMDITPSEEEILAKMRKTTRYLIRKSLGMGLTFQSTTDPKSSKILKKLQDETVKRHKFVGFPESLFKAQLMTFGKDDQGELFFVKKGRMFLAAAIIIFYGDFAYYHHSGSTSKFPNIPFSYFLQWKIILEAKKRGCKFYNFWGIAPTDNPRHRFAGVTIFKKGFGGERVDWLHAHDMPLTPLYLFTFVFETLRKIFRRV